MNTNAVAKQYQLEQWAQMISECRSSRIPVKDWFRQNSITKGNYYYRLRRVREAMIMATEQARVVEDPKDMYTPDILSTVHAPSNQGLSIVVGDATVCVEPGTSAELLTMVLRVMKHAQ